MEEGWEKGQVEEGAVHTWPCPTSRWLSIPAWTSPSRSLYKPQMLLNVFIVLWYIGYKDRVPQSLHVTWDMKWAISDGGNSWPTIHNPRVRLVLQNILSPDWIEKGGIYENYLRDIWVYKVLDPSDNVIYRRRWYLLQRRGHLSVQSWQDNFKRQDGVAIDTCRCRWNICVKLKGDDEGNFKDRGHLWPWIHLYSFMKISNRPQREGQEGNQQSIHKQTKA